MSQLNNTDESLREMYSNDDAWCSDFEGKCELLRSVLGPAGFEAIVAKNPLQLREDPPEIRYFDEFDGRIRLWLTTLPGLVRWAVEQRSGLWSGTALPDDPDSIGEQLGLSSLLVQALYREGLRILAKPEHRALLQLEGI